MTMVSSNPNPNPSKDPLSQFMEVRAKHPRITEALEDLELLTHTGVGPDINLLIGPTGVGKSTVIHALEELILKQYAQEMEADRGFIPVVSVEAPASGERGFSWRMLYQRLGEALEEPLMDRKQETVYPDGRTFVRPVGMRSPVAALRVAIEKALRHRKTRVVIVDEAVHLLRNLQGNTIENHMDALKSLANICGVKLVLVGSYDLLRLMHLSAQVARRTHIVHFQRYFTGNEADERAFQNVLKRFSQCLPLDEEVLLDAYTSTLHEACVGCVGTLKQTLSQALALALANGGKWSKKCLERALLTKGQTGAILEETIEGESIVRQVIDGTGSIQAAPQPSQKKTKAA